MSVASNLHFPRLSVSVGRVLGYHQCCMGVLFGCIYEYMVPFYRNIKVLFISLPGLGELFRQFQTRAGTARVLFLFFLWEGACFGLGLCSFLLEFATFSLLD